MSCAKCTMVFFVNKMDSANKAGYKHDLLFLRRVYTVLTAQYIMHKIAT